MNKLDKILDEYHKYLTLRKLCKTEHAPYLVGWGKQFLRFAKDKTSHNFETVIEMYSALEPEERAGIIGQDTANCVVVLILQLGQSAGDSTNKSRFIPSSVAV